jgi:predicted transcriptional regulator
VEGGVTYPQSPGWKEDTTSREAAEAIESHADTIRARVLQALREWPLTADETAYAIEESILTVRPRVTELFKDGRIFRTGERRLNRSGREAHVYRAPMPPPVQLVLF